MLSSDIDKTNMHEIVKSFVPAAAQETSVCCSARQTNGSKDVWFFWFAKCSLFNKAWKNLEAFLCLSDAFCVFISHHLWTWSYQSISESNNQSINRSTGDFLHVRLYIWV